MAGDAVYGLPPAELAATPAGAVQTSPLIPGSSDLGALLDLSSVTLLTPPGAVERRYVLAQAMRALAPDGALAALAPKDKGGSRLGHELKAFGCQVDEIGKRHHRVCVTRRPAAPVGVDEALAAGAPRREGEFWTQPGVFSWDRLDPGSALLMSRLPALAGEGADFGAGIGLLARQVLTSTAVTGLALVEVDRRAVDCARRNIIDPRAEIHWADVRRTEFTGLDFVVMNPPFHDGGAEDKTLGQGFIAAAGAALRKGGVCWMVANRHLPYERTLAECFAKVCLVHEAGGYKVYEATR